MNILIILARECNPIIGGIERVTHTLTKYWEKRGLQVYWMGVERSRWFNDDENVSEKQFFFPSSQDILSKKNEDYLKDLLEKKNIDVIINQATILSDVVSLCGKVKSEVDVKLISAIHFAPWTEFDIAKNNLFLFRESISIRSFARKCIEWAYFHFYNGRKIKNKEIRTISNICAYSDRVVVLSDLFIPEFQKISGMDSFSSITNPVESVQITEIPPKRRSLLYVARLEYGMKRFDRALKIWEKLSLIFTDWEFVVVGDGDYRTHFEKLSKQWGIERIKFYGYQSPEPYFSNAPILCLTSTTEGFGMVLVEAMQYGCIPVAYDSYTALSDIIEDGKNGYKVTAFKEGEFINKLSTLMTDEALREQLAINAMKTPLKFEASAIAERWIDLFERL